MAAKTVAKDAVPAKRCRTKPNGAEAGKAVEAGDAVESDQSVGALLRRCAEARAMPAPVGPEVPQPPPLKRPRGSSAQQCGKRIQREMSRAMPQICEMLLGETIEKKNLMALRALLQVAVFYGVNRAPGAKAKASQTADAGFARRMVEEFRQRSAAAGTTDGTETGRSAPEI